MAESIAAQAAHKGAIYRRLVGARVRSQLQYRASFWLNLAGSVGGTFIDFVAILVFFEHVPALVGWSLAEVAVLYAISGMAFGVTDLVMGHMDRLGSMIRMGEMDTFLIRPMGSLFQVLASDFQLRRVGKILQATAVLVVAVAAAQVEITLTKVALLVSTVLFGAVLFGAVWVIFASICFWTADASEMTNAFTYGGNFLAAYPITIFGTWVRRLLAFVVPMAFIAYFPALYLLDRPRAAGLAGLAPFATPLVAALFVVLAGLVWRFAVRHYRSTGS